MNDFTIGRSAGAGIAAKTKAGGGGRGAEQRSRQDQPESPRKPQNSSTAAPLTLSSSVDDDDLPTNFPQPRRQPAYPSSLSNGPPTTKSFSQRTPRPRRPQQQRSNRKDEPPLEYQSLEVLLRAAGYADVRIVTPESEKIQARVASERRRREERGFSVEDEESEVEGVTTMLDHDTAESSSLSSASTTSQLGEPRSQAQVGGWATWKSLGRRAGAQLLRDLSEDTVKPVVSRRRSALDMASHLQSSSSSSSANPLPPSPPPSTRFTTAPPDSPTPRTRSQPTAPVAANMRISSLSSSDCGSLSSSTSTNASTMLASPPDVPSRTFRGMDGTSPILGQETPDSDGQWSHSPPRRNSVASFASRADSRLEMSRSGRRRAESKTREEETVEKASSSATAPARASRRPESREGKENGVQSLRTAPVDKGKKVATTLDRDVPGSLAARKLREISSQASLRDSPKNRIKPKSSFSFGSAFSSTPAGTPFVKPRPLRHTASTPFFASSSSSDPPPLPPLPTNSTAAVKTSWFSTVSRNFFPTTIAAPATTTAARQPSNPHIRVRPSVPSFHPAPSNSSSSTPTTSLSSVSPRNQPLPTQVTSQTVFCSSESDEPASFVTFNAFAPFSVPSPPRTPVLNTKSSFSSGGSSQIDGGGGGDAWKKNLKGGGAGWTWSVTTAMEEDLTFWGGGAGPSTSTPRSDSVPSTPGSPSSTVPGRPLNAKGSIASLRAALAASDLAASLVDVSPVLPLPTVPFVCLPPPPPPEILISSPGTLEAGIEPRILDLDTEEFEGRDVLEGDGRRRSWRGSRRVKIGNRPSDD